jgi:transposase-like protein
MEYSRERAVGQFGLSTSTLSEVTDTVREEYEAGRTRELSKEGVAYLFMDTGDEPWRRGGQKTGVLGVWAIGEEGRQVFLNLSTPPSER